MSKISRIMLGLLIVLLLVFPLVSNPYIEQVAITWITYALLALGFAFSMRAGLPRIDIITWWGIGGFATVVLMGYGLNFFLASLGAGIICMILGWIVFSIFIPRGVTIFFMLCIIFSFAAPGLIKFVFMLPFLHVPRDIVMSVTLGPMEFVSKQDLYYLGLFLLALTLIAFYLLYNSKIGRAWDAINSSRKLAQSIGVNVVRYRVSNMVIGTFFIALAGSYVVAYSHNAPPLLFNLKASGMVMMYAFIGGLGHCFSGPILGSLLLTFLPEYFRVVQEYEPIITSSLAILVIIFMPEGILGWIDRKAYPRLRRYKWYMLLNRLGARGAPEASR